MAIKEMEVMYDGGTLEGIDDHDCTACPGDPFIEQWLDSISFADLLWAIATGRIGSLALKCSTLRSRSFFLVYRVNKDRMRSVATSSVSSTAVKIKRPKYDAQQRNDYHHGTDDAEEKRVFPHTWETLHF